MSATHLHFDCFSGISGDMTLGALVDLGVPVDALNNALAKLPIGGVRLEAERVKQQGIMGTKVHVHVEEEPKPHRHLHHVNEIVEAAGLPPAVLARAKYAYLKIAEAEATVHGSTPEKIHFHEVGAKDAIVDIAGAMLGFELLGIETFSVGPVVVGSGTVECRHGLMPVPAPATALLLEGLPTVTGPVEKEMTTPTGAAILATVVRDNPGAGFVLGEGAALVAEKTGYGAGGRVLERRANYLRAQLCRTPEFARAGAGVKAALETVAVLECEIDDMSPELAGHAMEQLLETGALDVQLQPVQMKKNRPGLRLTVLARPADEASLTEAVFRATSTFGLRRRLTERWALARRAETVSTELGAARVKIGLWGDDTILKVSPEYEDCRKLAAESGRALAEVFELVKFEIRKKYPRSQD